MAVALSAGRAKAGELTFLGWTDRGIALARLPNPCSQCDVPLADRIHAADGGGREVFLEDVPTLYRALAVAPETKQASLDGQPVVIKLTEIASPPSGNALRVTAMRNGVKVASTVVAGHMDSLDHIRNPTIVGMSVSNDGHHLAIAIVYDSGYGDTRGPQYTLAVLGPAATLPDAPSARNDIVEVRHGRPVEYERVVGWTQDGAAVLEQAHLRSYFDPSIDGERTMLVRAMWIDDGTRQTALSRTGGAWTSLTKLADRIDTATASSTIESERLGRALLPLLEPSVTGRAPEIRATTDTRVRNNLWVMSITLHAGKKTLVTRQTWGVPADAHVRAVVMSPDRRHAVVTVDFKESDPGAPMPKPPTTNSLSVVVTL
jgi:hypothetical protein